MKRPPDKRTPPGKGGVEEQQEDISSTKDAGAHLCAQVVPLRRYCSSCGGSRSPGNALCSTCAEWTRISALSAELARRVREVAR